MQWWQDARFGMFVCWGPVSLTGLEIGWSRGKAWPDQKQGGSGPTPVEVYDNLYKKWKPERFDPRQWVQLAKDAGCRYMILLVKHHDGYCLYDTRLTDYKSTSPEAAWRRDVMKDIADACHEAGVKLFIYYSQPDGRIEPRQADRYREIGKWLKQHGESIYGTRSGPFRSAGWGGTTCRGNTVYVHVLQWREGTLKLPSINGKIVASSLLTGGTLAVRQTDQAIEIAVPKEHQGPLDTVVVLELDEPAADVKAK
jgi:hypothetical protein